MREILFKAKRMDNGEWVEGQYVYFENPKTESGEPVKHFIGNGTTIFTDEIDLSTLCQYTGLKDKNGKRIWENDLVKSTASDSEHDWKLWKVVFMDGSYVIFPISHVKRTRKKLKCVDDLLCEDNIVWYGFELISNAFDK